MGWCPLPRLLASLGSSIIHTPTSLGAYVTYAHHHSHLTPPHLFVYTHQRLPRGIVSQGVSFRDGSETSSTLPRPPLVGCTRQAWPTWTVRTPSSIRTSGICIIHVLATERLRYMSSPHQTTSHKRISYSPHRRHNDLFRRSTTYPHTPAPKAA